MGNIRFKNEASVQRALEGNARGLRAVIGRNDVLYAYTVSRGKELAGRLVTLLEDPKETKAYRLSAFGMALAALAAKMEPKEAATVAARSAQRLAGLLEKPETNPYPLVEALAMLAAKIEPKEATSLAGRLVTVIEDPKEFNYDRLRGLAVALGALAAKMWPKAAATVAARGAQRLAGLGEDYLKETDGPYPSGLAEALVTLAAKMEPKEAASLAGHLVTVLEDPKETDAYRSPGLGEGVAALAAKMEPKEAASLAGHLVHALQNPKKTDVNRLYYLGRVLGTLSLAIPMARQTALLALSHMLLRQVPSQGDERNVVIRLCELLAPQDLAEVLKWPFAVGEAQWIVLASLEKKTGKQFAGDVWKFVEQAEVLGIEDIELSAKRPRVEDALEELEELRDGTADR